MSRVDIPSLYSALALRVNSCLPGGVSPISVKFPNSEKGELAFYKVVAWAYVMFHEAAKVPCAFLAELVGGEVVKDLKQDVARLRTYLLHNLTDSSKTDRKTIEHIKRWFRSVCGKDFPRSDEDYEECTETLFEKLQEALLLLERAAELLADPVDGARLLGDLKSRVSRDWPAHRFDEIALEVATELGMDFVDVRSLRERRLNRWRDALEATEIGRERDGVIGRIRSDLLELFGNARSD